MEEGQDSQSALGSTSVPAETLFIKQHLIIYYTPDLRLRVFLINGNIWLFTDYDIFKKNSCQGKPKRYKSNVCS